MSRIFESTFRFVFRLSELLFAGVDPIWLWEAADVKTASESLYTEFV